MKRPFACIGLGALAAMAAAAAFDGSAAALAAACFVLSAVLLALRIFLKREDLLPAAAVLLSAAVAFCAYFGAVRLVKEPVVGAYAGQRASFSGVITSEPYTSGATTVFNVRTDEVNGEPERINIRIYSDSVPDGGAYDIIEGSAVLRAVRGEGEGLGNGTSLEARRIFLEAYIGVASKTRYTVVKNDDPPLMRHFSRMRRGIAESFRTVLSEPEAALCTAMVTGDKTGLPWDVRSRFGTLGVAHIIVVSGLHLSIAAAFIGSAARRLFRIRPISCAVQLCGVLAFAALTAFGWSACRALIMISVVILSQLIHTKPDALNSLGFAALLLCLNPFSAGDVGLLWSFCGTFFIIVLSEPISEQIGKKLGSEGAAGTFAELIAAAVAAFIGSMPFVVLLTKTISLYTVAVNLIIVPVTGVIIVFGGVGAVLSLSGLETLSYLPMSVAGAAAKYMLFVTDKFSGLPGAAIRLESSAFAVWLIASACVITAIYFLSKNKKEIITVAAVVSAASFVLIGSAQVFLAEGRATLTIADVGSGLTAVLRYEGGSAVLASYGEAHQYATIRNILEGCTIETLADLPPDGAKYDYTRRILHDFPAGRVIVKDERRRLRGSVWYEHEGGEVIVPAEICTLELPDGNSAELYTADQLSCQFITLYGHTVLLCGGEGELPERYRSAEYAVITDALQMEMLSADTKVIVSDLGGEYGDERIINATNGEGRIDMTFSDRGVKIKKTYTGGVVRYADDNGS